jgi:hypothetical protein
MPSCHHVPTDLTAVPRHMGVWRRLFREGEVRTSSMPAGDFTGHSLRRGPHMT